MSVHHLLGASDQDRRRTAVTLLLVGILLAVRLLVWGGVRLVLQDQPLWLQLAFQLPSYLLTAILIWWERDRLPEYHIDGLAIVIIVLFEPVEILIRAFDARTAPDIGYPLWASASFLAIALGLAIALWRERSRLPPLPIVGFRHIAIGLLAGLALAVVLAYPTSFQLRGLGLSYPVASPGVLGALARGLLVQLGWAAIIEEPLFRGFLWGVLRKAGWKEVWVWLSQAFLFWIGHIYYLRDAPVSFWLIVPSGALILGLLVWRTRSISASMAAHAAVNSTSLYFASVAEGLRAAAPYRAVGLGRITRLLAA